MGRSAEIASRGIPLKESIFRGKQLEGIGEKLRAQHTANVASTAQEQARLRVGAGSAVQQKFQSPGGGSFAKRLEQSLRRGKARQGIVNRGDAAIRNQQLKDRLQLARSSVSRRGQIQGAAGSARQLRAGLDASERSAKSQVGSALAGAGGFIAGGAIRGFGDNLFNSDSTIPVETDTGTAAADFFNSTDLGSFDFFGSGGSQNA